MSPEELQAQYALSAQPYIDSPGPMTQAVLGLKSWRYVLEINSACQLKCQFCHAGNRAGYEYKQGVMDMGLLEKILDKIQTENANAVVCCYVNSDPFLHPRIADCVASIKRRGFRCEFSSNLNHIAQLDQVIAAKPDLFTVSVSGWTQQVYERAHRGGDVEKVKQNLKEVAEAMHRAGSSIFGGVSYHMYNDNLGEELAQWKAYCESFGWLFMLSWGRTITMENTVQACRYLESLKTGKLDPYEVQDGLDLNQLLPPVTKDFLDGFSRLRFPPDRAKKLYERWPLSTVCLVSEVFTEIRWDGRVQLCAWTDDMRLTLGNYLEMSQAQIAEARRNHPLCKECLKHRLNYYFHIVDPTKWDTGGI